MPRFLRPLLLLLLTGLLLAPGAAQAHDQLSGTDPADGAVLAEAPTTLTFTFSGEVAVVGAQVAVTGGPGGDHLVGEPVVDGQDVVQEVTGMEEGVYQVAWRVTSSDGHPISGTLGFTVGEEVTDDGTTRQVTAAATAAQEDDQPVAEGVDTGLPGWVWLVVGLAVLGLAALLVHTWTRNRRG
ncbi:MAG TPA: copper resistance CopC family protein [Ornithinimicrobium sp.]|nr:copper resistance CopC family protein [Ornithinimicrobium sp.]